MRSFLRSFACIGKRLTARYEHSPASTGYWGGQMVDSVRKVFYDITMSTTTVDDVRGFNRFYTRVLGLLGRPGWIVVRLTEAQGAVRNLPTAMTSRCRNFAATSTSTRYLSRIPVRLHRVRVGGPGEVGGRRPSPDRSVDGDGRRGSRADRSQTSAIDALLESLDDDQRMRSSRNGQIRRSWARCAGAVSFFDRPSLAISLGRRTARRPLAAIRLGRDVRGFGRARIVATSRGERRDTRRRRRGSPSWMASGSAVCSAPPADAEDTRSCGCCSSSRRPRGGCRNPAGTSAYASPGDPAIGESPCGPTMFCSQRAGSTSARAFAATVAGRTNSFGCDLVGEYWSRDL